MSDDKARTGPRDAKKVNVNEAYELDYWSTKFGVTPTELKVAVRKAGAMVVDVERELHRHDPVLPA
jgi:hypothetical protein